MLNKPSASLSLENDGSGSIVLMPKLGNWVRARFRPTARTSRVVRVCFGVLCKLVKGETYNQLSGVEECSGSAACRTFFLNADHRGRSPEDFIP
jgi:hypothetical protein